MTRERERRRKSSHARGYTRAWSRAAKAFLAENPLCVRCVEAGFLVAAVVVDHIDPHKGDQAKFWDGANWQSLCKSCHDAKTATEDGGFGNGGRDQ